MKQVVITKAGGPEVLQVRESADLTPAKGQVRIDVKAAGVNFADILARQGLYLDAPPLPCTVGYEVCGVVDKVGEGVDEAWLGKDVIALTRFNGHSSQVVVQDYQVFDKPADLSYEQGAAIPVTYLTAYQLVVAMGGLQANESILIHNVGGGVGLAALDLAKHIGATTYGTSSAKKHEFLKERGLDHAIDYRNDDWGKVLQSLTNGRGVDLITDPIGGSHLRKSYKNLANTGRLGMFGISTVADAGISGKLNMVKMVFQTPFYHPFGLMNNNKGVFGVNMGHLWHEHEKIRIWMNAIMAGYDEGWVRPYVDKSFSFENAGEAHSYIELRRNIGKVILTP
ncbi:MAG: medium chain dehydrogenase/reductase family protein [Pseudomonadales bacterium]|nr:medium chain dehydrogenase/reductase family protein [Pseudomonadales bacterium]